MSDTAGGIPRVVRSRAALADARAGQGSPVAVVMTLGALHEGHEALLRAARAQATTLIATVFVNPLQFGPGEDFDRYPRTFEADLAVCAGTGVDLVFAPPPEEIYPHGEPRVRVDPGPLGSVLEGASRPGHFAGVLTVVLKLLQLIRPDLSFFGEKDYQQLTLVRAMVRDLDVPTRIVAVPTVREADGLARSSRNRYLSPEQRLAAGAVPAALRAGLDAAATAAATPEKVIAAAAAVANGLDLDYLALTDAELRPLVAPIGTAPWRAGAAGGGDPVGGAARLLIAARVGSTRLIDNTPLDLPQDPDRQTPR